MPVIPVAVEKTVRRGWTAAFLDWMKINSFRGASASPGTVFGHFEDFVQDAGVTLPTPWGTQDTSAAGAPTLDYVAGAAGGIYTLKHAATSEVENITLYHADKKYWNTAKGVIFEARFKIDGTAAAVFPTNTQLVVGISGNRNATLSSNALAAWFRVVGAGAGRVISYESNDGTTHVAAASTGVSYVEATYLKVRIDATALTAVKFYINDLLVGTTAWGAATGNVQPYVELQKGADTGTAAVSIDWIKISADR